MTGQTIKISDILDEMYGGALPIANSRKSLKRIMTEAEYLDDTPEHAAKIAKTSAPQPNPTASDVLLLQQEAQEADDYEVLTKQSRSKKQVDSVNVIEINSGTSSSYISSDSSELDDSTLSLIHKITKTPQKANKSVPKKTDLVNQQPPQPTHQTTPEPSSTQTQTPTQTHTSPLQMIILKPVAETVVPTSEPSVSITVSEPTQNPTFTTNDQPSSSSSPSIQTLEQPPLNLLESEYIEAELLQISKDMQKLVQLRRAPTLSIAYEDQWATLKNRAYDLLNSVSQKCIRIQAAAFKRYFKAVDSAEEAQAPLLFLANAPFYPESDYVSREAKLFKLLKQKVLKQQEESKAREDFLLQRQLALEATLKQRAALIEQLMNKQPNP